MCREVLKMSRVLRCSLVLMKAVVKNAPMKSFIAPKTNFIEVYVTAVPEISTAIGIKDTNPPVLHSSLIT